MVNLSILANENTQAELNHEVATEISGTQCHHPQRKFQFSL